MQLCGRAAAAVRPSGRGAGASLLQPSPRPAAQRGTPSSVIEGSRGGPSSRQWGAVRTRPSALQQRPPAASPHRHLDLVVIGLVVSPPGFLPGLVQPPPPLDPSSAAAARAAAAVLRLASAAAARFLQQQLGLRLSIPEVVRRTWATPGGRVAAHISLPSPLAAQALARKRWRLRGTAFTVDLLRNPVELAQQKAVREQQGAAMAACPIGGGQAAAAVQAGAAVGEGKLNTKRCASGVQRYNLEKALAAEELRNRLIGELARVQNIIKTLKAIADRGGMPRESFGILRKHYPLMAGRCTLKGRSFLPFNPGTGRTGGSNVRPVDGVPGRGAGLKYPCQENCERCSSSFHCTKCKAGFRFSPNKAFCV